MAMPVCVIEGLGPVRGFARGRALTKGHRWKVLALVLLVIAAGLGLLATMRFLVRTMLSSSAAEIIGPVARIDGLTCTALWSVFFAVLLAASYYELRSGTGGNAPDQIVEVFE